MKRALMICTALVPLGLLGTGLATPASADIYGRQGDHDAYALTRTMRDDGYTGTVDYARQMANVICARRAEGYSQHAMQDYVSDWTGHKPSTPDNPDDLAIATVYGAEVHFCPTYFVPPWVS
jgi:hypothetical protein